MAHLSDFKIVNITFELLLVSCISKSLYNTCQLINAKFQLRAGDTEGARTSTVWARRLTLASYMAGTVVLVILLIVLYVSAWP
uniref:Uncharacterized protein n=1 Tax=Magallana gigas TaxID=29159 RepID=A0A8W8I103_MAGGI